MSGKYHERTKCTAAKNAITRPLVGGDWDTGSASNFGEALPPYRHISEHLLPRSHRMGIKSGGTSMEKIILFCLIVGTIGVLAELLPVLPSQK
jgi:hypothetical protein